MRVPKTKYARSGELAIAYQVHGDGPYDLLFSGTTASNVETRRCRFHRRRALASLPSLRRDPRGDRPIVRPPRRADRPARYGKTQSRKKVASLLANPCAEPENAAGVPTTTAHPRGGCGGSA